MFKFGFDGELKIEIVGADVPDGPMPTRKDSLSGKGYLRGVEMPSLLGGRPLHWVNATLTAKQQFEIRDTTLPSPFLPNNLDKSH